jgi:hypothetical protein
MSAVKNPVFDSLDVQQFLKLLGIPEVQIVFNLMVDERHQLSQEIDILKRLTALEVRTGLEDPIDEGSPYDTARTAFNINRAELTTRQNLPRNPYL